MNRKSLGKQIQKYRERAGYSQEKLAEIIECSTMYITVKMYPCSGGTDTGSPEL